MKVKVRATDASKKYRIPIIELKRIAMPGEIFEVDEKAFKRLSGGGPTRIKFVELYTESEFPEFMGDREPEKKKKGRKKKNENSD